MSEKIRSKSKPRGKKEDEESVQLVETLVPEQCGDEQPQQEDPPTEIQDVTPDKDEEEEPEAQVADLETDLQRKTGGKQGDDLDVKGEFVPSLEPAEMPEEDEKMNHVNNE